MGTLDTETFLLVDREIFLSRRTFVQTLNPVKNLAKEELSQMKDGYKLCILLCKVMDPLSFNVYRQNDYQLTFLRDSI